MAFCFSRIDLWSIFLDLSTTLLALQKLVSYYLVIMVNSLTLPPCLLPPCTHPVTLLHKASSL